MSDLVKQLKQEASKNGNRQSDPAFTNRQRKKFRYRNHLLNNAAIALEEKDRRIEELEAAYKKLVEKYDFCPLCRRKWMMNIDTGEG